MGVILIFSKAFDAIDHRILLQKLKNMVAMMFHQNGSRAIFRKGPNA